MTRMIDASKLPKGPYLLTKFTILRDVIKESPQAADLLTEYGLHCANCFFNDTDTLEKAADLHGMTDEEIDIMIDEINTELAKNWRKQEK
jgi:hybrid cluster-associated redox disulfide protein